MAELHADLRSLRLVYKNERSLTVLRPLLPSGTPLSDVMVWLVVVLTGACGSGK